MCVLVLQSPQCKAWHLNRRGYECWGDGLCTVMAEKCVGTKACTTGQIDSIKCFKQAKSRLRDVLKLVP